MQNGNTRVSLNPWAAIKGAAHNTGGHCLPGCLAPHIYLISFFPNWVTARMRASIKARIAQGRKGISEKAALEDAVVKSCSEQDTRYPL